MVQGAQHHGPPPPPTPREASHPEQQDQARGQHPGGGREERRSAWQPELGHGIRRPPDHRRRWRSGAMRPERRRRHVPWKRQLSSMEDVFRSHAAYPCIVAGNVHPRRGPAKPGRDHGVARVSRSCSWSSTTCGPVASRVGTSGRRLLRDLRVPHHLAPAARVLEHRQDRPVRFWARRARRLLPAAYLVLAATAVPSPPGCPVSTWQTNYRQIIASTLYVQNWVLAADSVDYLASYGPRGGSALLEPVDRGAVLPRLAAAHPGCRRVGSQALLVADHGDLVGDRRRPRPHPWSCSGSPRPTRRPPTSSPRPVPGSSVPVACSVSGSPRGRATARDGPGP